MRDRLTRWLPPALATGAWLILYGPLLDLSKLPLLRDLQVFHLPLRTEFARQLHEGLLPVWNATINGGQPILSNPNYAAFYPLTWALAWIPQHSALNLLLFVHALWAFWGAYRLVRRFGGSVGPASLAALAFSTSPLLGIYDTVTIFCSWTWFPWILGWAADAMRLTDAPDRRNTTHGWRRSGVLAALGFALQLFAGDPTSVILTGLAVGCLWITSGKPIRIGSWRRPALIAVLALLLAAAQLWPTAGRLGGTARASIMTEAMATQWSMPPARYVELLLPRFFGHPTDNRYGLYFGRGIGDLDLPYVPTIYVGQVVLLFALAGFLLWPIRRRWCWVLMASLSALLALGRFNPIYASIVYRIPPFNFIRYPEKFFLLTAAALVFAGALAWQKLLDYRRDGHHERADFPIAIAAVFTTLAATYWALLDLKPGWFNWLVRPHQFMAIPESTIAHHLAYLQHWALAAVGIGLTLTALLVLHRLRRVPEGLLVTLTLLLAVIDVVAPAATLMKRSPVGPLLQPPPVLDGVSPRAGRIYTGNLPSSRVPYISRNRQNVIAGRLTIEQAYPYTATLWGYAYALNPDFDFMLTRWGRNVLGAFTSLWTSRTRMATYKFLGAWNVGTVILPTPPQRSLEEQREGEVPPIATAERNQFQLPRFRFVPKVTFHSTIDAALQASRGEYYEFPVSEHWIGDAPDDWPETLAARTEAGLEEVHDLPGRIDVHYEARHTTAFVAAMTYHEDWTARVDGARVTTYPTETGQIGILLPAGEHTLTLKFWEPAVTRGAVTTLFGLLLAAMLWIRSGRH